ncbi:hypothetical protein HMPREF9413_2134 [Paenibacillus sp. HGF7]|nr:hypothetical protein HMPREF9413_2134 [Paenibacillus sp. HGF7]
MGRIHGVSCRLFSVNRRTAFLFSGRENPGQASAGEWNGRPQGNAENTGISRPGTA